MDLASAYRKIWAGKLPTTKHPSQQSIERVNQTASLIEEHFGRVGRLSGPLIDVGCGSGAMLARAAALGFEPIGVDFDGDLLEWLRQFEYPVTACDLNEGRLPNGPFVAATSTDVIEHLIDPDHMLAEIYRVLAPGGHAYISTPNCAFWKRVQQLAGGEMFRTSGDQVLRDGGHLAYFGPADLEAAMVRAGFRAVQIHYRNHEAAPGKWNMGTWSNYHYMIAVGEKKH